MSAQIISGRDISASIRSELEDRVAALREEQGVTPGLATVLVGANPASEMYVGMKNRAAAKLGIHSRQITLDADTTQDELMGVVEGLNADPGIHGILVQLPLPDGLDEAEVLEAIDPAKDVDGFHPLNVGRLLTGSGDFFAPCTPAGVVEMLLRTGHDPQGKEVVVLGRSNIVGQPLANLLLRKAQGGNATVTLCHTGTPDIGKFTREADIVIAAVGRPEVITAEMVREGAVVVDVGVNRVEDASKKRGYRLVGDCAFEPMLEKVSAITPVPGGVGPMTITMLLYNTLESAQKVLNSNGDAIHS